MLSDGVAQRLQVLCDNDSSAYHALARVMPDLEGRFSGEHNKAALLDLLCQTSAEAPPAPSR